MNKKKAVSLIAVAVLIGSLFATTQSAYAANGGFLGGNFFTNFIHFLSQKFGLNLTTAQVQSAVQDFKQQRKAMITPRPTMSPQQQQDAEKKRLDPLVIQGKITTAQESAIIAELDLVRSENKFDPNETPAERKAQMTNIQNALTVWAKANSIDPTYMTFGGMGRGIGRGMGGGFRP